MDGREEIVCRCEEVTRAEIEAAIAAGDTTLSSIKKRTRAGMGYCQGKTCQRLIAQMITGKTGGEVSPSDASKKSERMPVGPLTVGMIAETDEEDI